MFKTVAEMILDDEKVVVLMSDDQESLYRFYVDEMKIEKYCDMDMLDEFVDDLVEGYFVRIDNEIYKLTINYIVESLDDGDFYKDHLQALVNKKDLTIIH